MSFASVNAQRSATNVASSTAHATATAASVMVVGATNSKNIAPAVPSGFARRRNIIIGGLLGLALLYHGVYNLVKDMVRSTKYRV
jgi:hypothetical protein